MITIPGCTAKLIPDDKPAIGVFGLEGTGKTRFAATAPGPIGLIALDKKSKRTFQEIASKRGVEVISNEKPFISDKDAIEMAITSGDDPKGLAKIKATYTSALTAIFDMTMAFAAHKEVQTVVVDTTSQLFEMILFSHFGRRNQIQPTSRGAANQDMIDFVNALRCKNLVLIHRSKEIWKPTGALDRQGQQIKEPSGKFEQEGFKHIGGFLTANLELTSKKMKTDDLSVKFHAKVITSQSACLMEGQDLDEYGINGEDITWDNVVTVLGLLDES